MVHHAVVVLDAEFFEQPHRMGGGFPGRGYPAFGVGACEGFVDGDGFGEDGALLGLGEARDVFVGVAVQSSAGWSLGIRSVLGRAGWELHLVAGIPHFRHLFWERKDGVAGHVP